MSKELLNLTSNPLALVRSLPTIRVPLDKIEDRDDLEDDEVFISKYAAFLSGKTSVHETRVALESVQRGFWKKVSGEWVHVEDPVLPRDLEHVISLIRLGHRPALHIYESPTLSNAKRFVCADDCVSHAAYEKLGIAKVPAVLMSKPRNLDESSLSVRCYSRGKRDKIALLDGFVPVLHETVPSVLGKNRDDTTTSCDRLLKILSTTKIALKAFHQPGSTQLHYHHTLYSVLVRAEDAVEGMKLLITAGKPLTAAGLLRSLHELVLVFYVDWLSPTHTYRYLQMAAVQTEKEWAQRCDKWRISDIKGGATAAEAKSIRDAHMRAFRLGSVVGDRARLFPLGEQFQRDIYSFLSDVIHHDFSMTARYAYTLEHGDEAVYQEEVAQTIVHISDILIAAIVSRIRDDIGNDPDLAISDR
ncbi:MAG: hypothetical protein ACN6PM_04050 [Achromobacter mucicolens]|uniref:hypothetical protein n=1 Tax=Achromobacter mucicolens TaxID=1389922 RepID=UPI003D120F75